MAKRDKSNQQINQCLQLTMKVTKHILLNYICDDFCFSCSYGHSCDALSSFYCFRCYCLLQISFNFELISIFFCERIEARDRCLEKGL